jgi:acetyl esterase/lipase
MTFYLSDVGRTLPYMSPVLAEDLTGLPPSLVFACGCDFISSASHREPARLFHARNRLGCL